jgi:hypothetical protein
MYVTPDKNLCKVLGESRIQNQNREEGETGKPLLKYPG